MAPRPTGGSGRRRTAPIDAIELPSIHPGTPKEYRLYKARARRFLQDLGTDPSRLDRVAATYNYRKDRILLFELPVDGDELSASDTLAHELLHAILEKIGERWAARTLDGVIKPVGHPARRGGI